MINILVGHRRGQRWLFVDYQFIDNFANLTYSVVNLALQHTVFIKMSRSAALLNQTRW